MDRRYLALWLPHEFSENLYHSENLIDPTTAPENLALVRQAPSAAETIRRPE